ncbi:MAG TPA: aldo/keto reductase [Caulifigura sp.]|jgi:aryl-alcohol dehydrogenase-like predicted oxidoreductase|nr:aldo/keto reductase [Caulifigura sp.]
METRPLGRLAIPVSRLVLGTMTFGKQVDERAAASMLDVALERGVNFVDTANVYTGGASEQITGRLLMGRRDKVVLATKVGITVGQRPLDVGLSRKSIEHQCEQSLKRLGTDVIDLYYLHQPDAATPIEQSLEAMGGLIRQGKVREFAVSNYSAWRIADMRRLAELKGMPAPVAVQPVYNLLARRIEAELLPMCRAYGMRSIAYNPLAGGILTGKHTQEATPPAGTRFDNNDVYRSRYWHAENFAAVERLKAAAGGRSLVSVALAWVLNHTAVDCVILGASSLEQLRQNLDAAESGPLSAELLAACEEIWPALRGVAPAYQRD